MVYITTEIEKVINGIIKKVENEQHLTFQEARFLVNRYTDAINQISKLSLAAESTDYMSKVFKEGLDEAKGRTDYWKEQHEEALVEIKELKKSLNKALIKNKQMKNEVSELRGLI